LVILRFLDDWAYQANIRQELSIPDIKLLKDKMQSYENLLKKKFNMDFDVTYSFPWNRLFEVGIELN
jgi:hypothetical protein